MKTAEWIIVGAIVFYIFTLLALFDILRKDFGGIEKKALWAFISAVPFIGVIIYLTVGFRKGKTQSRVQTD